MSKKTKQFILVAVSIIAILILLAKISNWFMDYDEQTAGLINTIMFVFIGLAWCIYGLFSDDRKTGAIIIACGLYLMVLSFLPESDILNVLAILCMLVPMLMSRFQRGKADEVEA